MYIRLGMNRYMLVMCTYVPFDSVDSLSFDAVIFYITCFCSHILTFGLWVGVFSHSWGRIIWLRILARFHSSASDVNDTRWIWMCIFQVENHIKTLILTFNKYKSLAWGWKFENMIKTHTHSAIVCKNFVIAMCVCVCDMHWTCLFMYENHLKIELRTTHNN